MTEPESPERCKTSSSWRRLVLLAVVFIGVPALVLEYAGVTPLRRFALAVIFVIWAAFLLGMARARKQQGRGGALAFNVGFLLLALAVVETYAGTVVRNPARYARRPAAGTYIQKDELLGFAPVPGSASRFTNAIGDQVLFDVTYTIDDQGHRIQPPVGDPPPAESVLCFGGSFTYGTGLPDERTWPWRLQELLGDAYRVRNFAFLAYGPHQMLAALEGGRVEATVAETPRHAIYLAIPDHARRVAGNAGYGRDEPRYVMQEDGSVVRDGLFADVQTHVWSSRLRQFAGHSNVARLIQKRVGADQYDVPRLAAIVDASRAKLQTSWPECEFHVVLWDSASPFGVEVREALEARGFEIWPAETLLPGLAADRGAYRIHEADSHPNARAAEELARALAERIR